MQGGAEGGQTWQDRQQRHRDQAVASPTGMVPAPVLRRKSRSESIDVPVQIQTTRGEGLWGLLERQQILPGSVFSLWEEAGAALGSL